MKKKAIVMIVGIIVIVGVACLLVRNKDNAKKEVVSTIETITPTSAPTEPSTENIKIDLNKSKEPKVVIKDVDGSTYEPVEIDIDRDDSTILEKGENGSLIEKARENQEKIDETRTDLDVKDKAVVTDEMHQELQQEIDEFNQKQYEKMMEEAKKFEA